MNNLLLSAAQVFAGSSTIPPDKDNLDAGTVASVVITGIVVVFIALILLILCVSIYGKIFDAINKRSAAKAEAKAQAAKAEAPAKPAAPAAPAPVVEDGIGDETVAVIMAAISAMEGSSGKKLVLKSVKTAKPQRPAWSAAGIIENTRPF